MRWARSIGLRFDGRVPPGIEQKHVLGGGQVQAQAAGLQADQEQLTVGIVLEPLDPRLAVARLAVEIFVGDLLAASSRLAHDRQQAGELRKHQRLVSFLEHLLELRQQRIELGAGFLDAALVDQPGMAGRLPQAQQRFEHLDLRLARGRRLRSFFSSARAIVIAQLVVELALRRASSSQ